jgi:hypothetical protein
MEGVGGWFGNVNDVAVLIVPTEKEKKINITIL